MLFIRADSVCQERRSFLATLQETVHGVRQTAVPALPGILTKLSLFPTSTVPSVCFALWQPNKITVGKVRRSCRERRTATLAQACIQFIDIHNVNVSSYQWAHDEKFENADAKQITWHLLHHKRFLLLSYKKFYYLFLILDILKQIESFQC